MSQLPTPPRERDLPDRQRRRAELLAAIRSGPDSARRRVLVPLGTAAAVLGLVVGGAVTAQSMQSQGTPPVQSAPKPSPVRESPERPEIQPPDAHDLTPGERNEALSTCVDGASDWQGFEPVIGVTFGDSQVPDAPPDQPRTFLVAERGDDRLYCTLDQNGAGSAGLFGNADAKDVPYLFAPVDGKGTGFGMFTEPVARVTLQRDGGPERAAALRDGYWFLPITPDDLSAPPAQNEPFPEDGSNLIGVPAGYTIRGYDQSGELVYDSDQDGPEVTSCYTDPAGKEVLVHNGVNGGNPDPEDCRRTYEWRP